MQRGYGPRSRCRSRFPGSQAAVGGGPRLRTGGTTQVHRLRTVRLAALLVGLAMVAAACGGGGDEGGDTSGGSGAVQQGGTLNYAADQEPTGFNDNTSKDNGTSVALNITINMFPAAVPSPAGLHGQDGRRVPGLGRADQRGPADGRLQDQAERRLVGRHAGQRRRLHLPLGEPQRHEQGQRLSPPPPATTRSRASTGLRQRQDGHRRLQDPVRRLEVASSPDILPAHYVEAQPGGWNTGLDKNPEKIPSAGPFIVENYTPGQSLTLTRNDKYCGHEGPPRLDRLPLPARVDHPAGGAAEQRGRPDLPAAPARPGPAGQGAARRDQPDQLRADVRALRLQLQERAPRRPQGAPGDRHRPQHPGAGRPHRQAVQRPGPAARQPHLAERPARVPGPLRPVRQGRRGRGDEAARGGRLRQGRRRHLRQGRQEAVGPHLHHRRQQAPRDPGASCSRPR